MANQNEPPQPAGNAERVAQAESFVEIMLRHYWTSEAVVQVHGFQHEPHGYEHHVPPHERNQLRYRYDQEAFDIRFRPDALVTQGGVGEETYNLIEYKTTTTPRYSFYAMQWDRGQIEADPWEYYLRRIEEGERLAILNYCSFHARPLLCDYPTLQWQVGQRQQVYSTVTGSRTDYYNTNLRMMRPFEQFMQEEFGVPEAISMPLIRQALAEILGDPRLQTQHDRNSVFHGSPGHRTGFNWAQKYR
jgi:hypothetical protein